MTAYAYNPKELHVPSISKNMIVEHVEDGTIYSGIMTSPDDISWIDTIGNIVYNDSNFEIISKKTIPVSPNVVLPSHPDASADIIKTIDKTIPINPRGGVVLIAMALGAGASIVPTVPLKALCGAAAVYIADKASNCKTTYEYIIQYMLRGANGQISYAQSIVTYRNANRTGYITSSYHWWKPN